MIYFIGKYLLWRTTEKGGENCERGNQEEYRACSAATSEKENRTASQGTEASQPATSLDEEPEIADYGPLPSKAQMQYHREELAASSTLG